MKINKVSWFWIMVREYNKSVGHFDFVLDNMSRSELEDFYGLFKSMSDDICDFWEGPYIYSLQRHLSEFETRELCNWIVSQGKGFYTNVINGNLLLSEAWQLKCEDENGTAIWGENLVEFKYNGGYTPLCLVVAKYEERFCDDIYDFEDEIYNRIHVLL